MAELDNIRMWASIRREAQHFTSNPELVGLIDLALKEQGLQWDGEDIVAVKTNQSPKFKVGDWIVFRKAARACLSVMRVVDPDDKGASLCRLDGTEDGRYSWADLKDAHLWTLADANDGDVLYGPEAGCLIIFNGKTYDSVPGCYCIYWIRDCKFEASVKGSAAPCSESFVPATEQQRNFMLATCCKFGYVWIRDGNRLFQLDFEPQRYLKSIGEPAPPEQTEDYEKALVEIMDKVKGGVGDDTPLVEVAELLTRARKDFDERLEKAYRNADKVQHDSGYNEAVDAACEWLDKNAGEYWHGRVSSKMIGDLRNALKNGA